MKFVLHSSVSARWLLRDADTEAQAYAEAVLASLIDNEAIVPANWWLDVAKVIAAAERARLCSLAETERFAKLLGRLPISERIVPGSQLMQKALPWARQHGLSTGEASYMTLASVENLPVASVNDRLSYLLQAGGIPRYKFPPR